MKPLSSKILLIRLLFQRHPNLEMFSFQSLSTCDGNECERGQQTQSVGATMWFTLKCHRVKQFTFAEESVASLMAVEISSNCLSTPRIPVRNLALCGSSTVMLPTLKSTRIVRKTDVKFDVSTCLPYFSNSHHFLNNYHVIQVIQPSICPLKLWKSPCNLHHLHETEF